MAEAKPQSTTEQILLSAAFIAWMNNAAQGEKAPHLASKNTALLHRFVQSVDGERAAKDGRTGILRNELLELLRRQDILRFLRATFAAGRERPC